MCLVYGQFKDCRLCQSGLGSAFAKSRERSGKGNIPNSIFLSECFHSELY